MKKIVVLVLAAVLVLAGCGEKASKITEDRAKEIALEHAGISKENAEFVRAERDLENGKTVYDVEFYSKDRTEYDYEIDADTGEILSYKTDAPDNKPSANTTAEETASSGSQSLTEAEAKQIALDKVPGATEADIKEFKTENDDGINEYEGKIIYDNTEYEFEINADTGEILKWESESTGK